MSGREVLRYVLMMAVLGFIGFSVLSVLAWCGVEVPAWSLLGLALACSIRPLF